MKATRVLKQIGAEVGRLFPCRASTLVGFGVLSFLLCIAVGCNSGSGVKSSAEAPAKTTAAVHPSSESDNPGISLQCAVDRIQKAAAPFHWSFKKIVTPDTNADWEADVTPDAIGGTLIDSSGTRAIHGARSDQTSWNTAVLILSGPLPASTFSLVNNSSAMARAGTETANGQDTVKYTIDTSQESTADAGLIRSVMGPGGSIKGTVWVTHDGCPVKFVLDAEQHNKDGSVEKEHYELSVTTS